MDEQSQRRRALWGCSFQISLVSQLFLHSTGPLLRGDSLGPLFYVLVALAAAYTYTTDVEPTAEVVETVLRDRRTPSMPRAHGDAR